MNRRQYPQFAVLLIVLFCAIWPFRWTFGNFQIPNREVHYVVEKTTFLNQRTPITELTPALSELAAFSASGRYRFQYWINRSDIPEQDPTLFIPSVGGDTYALVNGALLIGSSRLDISSFEFGTHWLIAEIPENVLVPGKNRIELVVDHHSWNTKPSALYLGPRAILVKAEQNFQIWVLWLPRITLVLGLTGVLLSVLTGMLKSQWSLSFAFWVLMSALIALTAFPSALGTIGTQSPALRFVKLLCPLALFIVLVSGTFWTRLHPPDDRNALQDSPLYWFTVAACFAGIVHPFWPFGISSAIIVILSWILPASLAAFIPLTRFFVALQERRSTVESLTQKVQEQAVELDAKSRRVAYEMRNRAILEERQRFTRDMHDGIGGQLLSLLLRIRTGRLDNSKIAEEIQASLNDLRLVVDSIDHLGDNLSGALRTFRVRAEPQMQAAGIAFEWSQPDEIEGKLPAAGSTLHLYRMIQEALSNVVRHASADTVAVEILNLKHPNRLQIAISDDGKGLAAPPQNLAGKGIRNICDRAKALGAEVTFEQGSNGRGTLVRLIFPLVADTGPELER